MASNLDISRRMLDKFGIEPLHKVIKKMLIECSKDGYCVFFEFEYLEKPHVTWPDDRKNANVLNCRCAFPKDGIHYECKLVIFLNTTNPIDVQFIKRYINDAGDPVSSMTFKYLWGTENIDVELFIDSLVYSD